MFEGKENALVRGAPHGQRSLRTYKGSADFWEQMHHIYVFLALLGIIVSFFLGSSWKEKLLLGAICGYIVVIAGFAAWSTYINGAKARYSIAVRYLAAAANSIKDINVLISTQAFKEGEKLDDAVLTEVKDVLDCMASAFEMVSSVPVECRVELIERPSESNNDGDFYTYPLARDRLSEGNYGHIDRDARTHPHPVRQKSAYAHILHNPSNGFYFCGSLQTNVDFRCPYKDRFPEKFLSGSILVWPIWLARTSGHAKQRLEIVGFLHAESVSRDAFNLRYDNHMGEMFSSLLFNVLFRYVSQRKDVQHAVIEVDAR